jgi:Transposase DDE domain.
VGCSRTARTADILAAVMDETLAILKDIGHPEYGSARSKRTYSDHVKIGLLVIRQFVGGSYEDFIRFLPSIGGVLKVAGMRNIPDPSTLWKFAGRLDHDVLENVLQRLAKTCCSEDMIIAVDSTGFSLRNISRHMEKRVKEFGVRSEIKRDFVKTTFSVDTRSLMILSCDCVDSRNADVKRMEHAITSLMRGGFSVGCVVADKGYDAEYVHRDIHERLGAEAFIPIRNMSEPARSGSSKIRTSGFHRGRMKFFFDKVRYNQRSKVETVNSMVKRKMGDVVNSRIPATSGAEVILRAIAHNFRRLLELKPESMEGMIS